MDKKLLIIESVPFAPFFHYSYGSKGAKQTVLFQYLINFEPLTKKNSKTKLFWNIPILRQQVLILIVC